MSNIFLHFTELKTNGSDFYLNPKYNNLKEKNWLQFFNDVVLPFAELNRVNLN